MFRLSDRELLGLWANIEMAESAAELRSRRAASELTFERLYDLILATTCDVDAAEKAAHDFLAERLRRGDKVNVQEG